MKREWFSVDRAGLRKLVEGRGMASVLFELYQNSSDEASEEIDIRFEKNGDGKYQIIVRDDNPDGFKDLSHAYTLFAESSKKGNPEQAGRFNLGEKLVLALCSSARISSTKGTVIFSDALGRSSQRTQTAQGSVFTGELRRCTIAQHSEAIQKFRSVIPKPGTLVFLNGEEIPQRLPIKTIRETLTTEISDGEGVLRPTRRQTDVNVYEVREGEIPTLYELGIPVVEIDCQWHVSVEQKVPLNMQRDNVNPAYLRDVRVTVLNAMHDQLEQDEAASAWVRDAIEDEKIAPEAVKSFMDKAFGEKRVAYDPSDPEANNRAVAAGYVVVHGRNLSGAAWENVRAVNAILPAGQVTPSPKPYGPDGTPLVLLPDSKLTSEMKLVREYAQFLAQRLMGVSLKVDFTNDSKWFALATYGKACPLRLNIGRLGKAWFNTIGEQTDDLFLHEFAHEYELNHLSSNYYDSITKLAAKLVQLALNEPEAFRRFRKIKGE